MRKLTHMLLAGTLILACSSCGVETTANYQVIPLPQEVALSQESPFNLNDGTIIAYPEHNELLKRNAEFLAEYISQSTGANATNDAESFIDNISLEYRLDASGTRYVRVFHNKNYESILDGEITETGVGLVLRRKMDRLSELFIFRKKKIKPEAENSDMKK